MVGWKGEGPIPPEKDNQPPPPPEDEPNASQKWGLNYVKDGRLFPVFYSALCSYFEEILDAFITSDGWLLTDFINHVKRFKLGSIYACVGTPMGNEFERSEHNRLVTIILLEACKYQWLCPYKKQVTLGLSTCMKRQIGGLYLLYIVYRKQPFKKVKIPIDQEESQAIRFFMLDLEKVKSEGQGGLLKAHCSTLFLELKEEFSLCIGRFENSIQTPLVYLSQYRRVPSFNYFCYMKDLRDKLLYCAYNGLGASLFRLTNNRNQEKQRRTKRKWDADQVEKLEDERDLSAIGEQILDIIKFITPPKVQTVQRGCRGDPKAEENSNKDISTLKITKEIRLHAMKKCASRVSQMSKKGNYRCVPSKGSEALRYFLTGKEPSIRPNLDPKEIIQKLKTMQVVSFYPYIQFASNGNEGEQLEEREKDSKEESLEAMLEYLHENPMPLDMPMLDSIEFPEVKRERGLREKSVPREKPVVTNKNLNLRRSKRRYGYIVPDDNDNTEQSETLTSLQTLNAPQRQETEISAADSQRLGESSSQNRWNEFFETRSEFHQLLADDKSKTNPMATETDY